MLAPSKPPTARAPQMIKSYLAFIHGTDGYLCDVYAANNLITLSVLIAARGLAPGEFVKYNREFT